MKNIDLQKSQLFHTFAGSNCFCLCDTVQTMISLHLCSLIIMSTESYSVSIFNFTSPINSEWDCSNAQLKDRYNYDRYLAGSGLNDTSILLPCITGLVLAKVWNAGHNMLLAS